MVVKGTHCRLKNISAAGTWVESEEFRYGAKIVKRTAGKSAGMCLKSYVDLRNKEPALFEGIEVYSQPAAVVDGIIMQWMMEEQAAAFPCSMWCRDMLQSGQSVQVRLVQSLAQQMGCRVYGGITPILQVTDTDYSWSFKSGVAKAQMELRKQLKAEAALQGKQCTFKCGAREIMQVIASALEYQKQRELQTPWLLQACRRHGYFHWRPDFSLGRLVKAGMQPWTEGMPEGSYRYPSSWLENRDEELDAEGQPLHSTMEDLYDVEKFEKLLEANYCRDEGFMQVVHAMKTSSGQHLKLEEVHCSIDVDELVDDEGFASAVDLLPPKKKKVVLRAAAALKTKSLEMSRAKNAAKKRQQKWSRQKVLMKKGKEMLAGLMKTMSRKEAIKAMRPEAGKNVKKQKKKEKKNSKTAEEKKEDAAKQMQIKKKLKNKTGKFVESLKAGPY